MDKSTPLIGRGNVINHHTQEISKTRKPQDGKMILTHTEGRVGDIKHTHANLTTNRSHRRQAPSLFVRSFENRDNEKKELLSLVCFDCISMALSRFSKENKCDNQSEKNKNKKETDGFHKHSHRRCLDDRKIE
ncbi:hypothetical protein NPIL_288091 [Nephila pilipes]|uniref:Uncharacterized protein n=1 Tax=Nephila pilipes TaxID=299642 RepID=A0A8X6QPF1_NEPPI|nr:hypothetical protein NPIL_288091 [Nephila pilipes]